MRSIPLWLVKWIFRLLFIRRPQFLAGVVDEAPSQEELQSNMLLLEIRDGFSKWAHLKCPKCGDHIQLPLAGNARWSVKVDLLRRPTVAPSIWEKQTCGAHFWVRKGGIDWCE